MRDEGISEVAEVGRGASQPTPDRLGRLGLHDRTNLRASLDSAQAVDPIYWHSELPPVEAEAMGEHLVEATSLRVPGTLAHRDELWDSCYKDLMRRTHTRLEQEIVRLGGNYAHVLSEAVDSRHDGGSGENWLHGRFSYMLYRQPANR
jgi:hypothetical protein